MTSHENTFFLYFSFLFSLESCEGEMFRPTGGCPIVAIITFIDFKNSTQNRSPIAETDSVFGLAQVHT